MRTWQNIRDLARLVWQAPRNPLVTHDLPWERGTFLGILLSAQMVVVLGWWAYAIRVFIKTAAEGSFNSYRGDLYYLALSSLYLAFLSSLVTFPLNLILFRSRWMRPEILTEAWMTSLPPRQMAFGSIFWGVTIGFMIPLAFLAIALPCAVLVFRPREEVLILTGVAAAGVICCCLVSVWSWFRIKSLKFLLFLRVPAMMTLLTFWSMFSLLGPMITLDRLRGFRFEEEIMIGVAFAWLVWLTLRALNWACELAPTRAFAPIFPDTLDRQHFVDAGLSLMREPAAKSAARRRLRELVPLPWKSTLLVLAAIALVSGAVTMRPGVRAFSTVLTVYYFCGAAALAASAVLLLELQANKGRPPALVSGLAFGSIARRLFPLTICFLIAFSIPSTLAILRMHEPAGETLAAVLVTALAPLIFMYFFVTPATAWCLASRFPRAMLLSFGLLTMGVALCCLPYRPVSDRFWIEIEHEQAAGLLLLYATLITPPMTRAFQALHRKHLAHVPVGESNVIETTW